MTETANTGPENNLSDKKKSNKPTIPGPDHKIGNDTSHLSNAAYAKSLPAGMDPWDVRAGWDPHHGS